jgi:carboxyl-terminal processing protease
MVQGFSETLKDPYVKYYSPKEYTLFKQEMAGKYQGIGAIVKYETRDAALALVVIKPLPQSPAEKACLRPGDIIVAIDGDVKVPQYTLAEAVSLLRGPQGSQVVLKIFRPDTGDSLEVHILREALAMQGFEYRMLPTGVGYVQMKFFHKGFAEELGKILARWQSENIPGVVLDMRSCSGGLVEEAVAIAGLFLGAVPVVHLKSHDKIWEKSGEQPACFSRPVAVLIEKETMSGAELVAGALQDHGRATLIGERSHGKGSVQELFALPNGGALKLTTGHYLTPKSSVVEKRGIAPDLEVVGEENQIERAVAWIAEMAEKGK